MLILWCVMCMTYACFFFKKLPQRFVKRIQPSWVKLHWTWEFLFEFTVSNNPKNKNLCLNSLSNKQTEPQTRAIIQITPNLWQTSMALTCSRSSTVLFCAVFKPTLRPLLTRRNPFNNCSMLSARFCISQFFICECPDVVFGIECDHKMY